MANMTFKADLLPNSDYGYSLGSTTSNNMKRWIIPGTTIETIIGPASEDILPVVPSS